MQDESDLRVLDLLFSERLILLKNGKALPADQSYARKSLGYIIPFTFGREYLVTGTAPSRWLFVVLLARCEKANWRALVPKTLCKVLANECFADKSVLVTSDHLVHGVRNHLFGLRPR